MSAPLYFNPACEPDVLAACAVETLQELAGSKPASSAAPEALLTSRAAAQIGHYWLL
jgi:hypothetical protein